MHEPHTKLEMLLCLLFDLLELLLLLALSWGVTCLVMAGVCWCFDLPCSYKIATGVWLILTYIKFQIK